MSSFILKIIACFTMFIDHLRYIVPGNPIIMSYIGRLAFPIFAFQSANGYSYTKNLKKYLLRLLVFALISQIPYHLYFNTNNLNVLFTLLLGLICIYSWEKFEGRKKIISIPIIIAIIAISEILHTDYGYYGIIIMLIFHIFKNKKIFMTIAFLIMTLIFFIINYKLYYFNPLMINHWICTSLGIVPCLLYNGKQGHKVKYLFYIFYPTHIALLLLFSYIL